jgi:predicted Co/Zn/Cd cation transporter (cation efflux family)
MRASQFSKQSRGITAIDGAMALIVVLLMVQIWLLSATLDGYLSGHREVAWPGAIVSGILFAACAGLYLFVRRLEATARDEANASE